MGKQEEIFDIFDAAMNRIGTAARSEAHAKGLWHRTFQCWIVRSGDNGRELLFQLRHPDKDTFPGLLDTSCAGHLLAGESVADGVRELEEELGLSVSFAELCPCGVYPEEEYISPEVTDREFCHLFVYESDRPLDAYRLQAEEVAGLFAVRMEEAERLLVLGEAERVTAVGVVPDEAGRLVPLERTFAHGDFTPHAPAYYELLFRALGEGYM